MSNWKLHAGVAAAALATAAIIAPAEAQVTTSEIRGEVVNEAGAPVSGADVVIVHTPSGTTSTATTSANGIFAARGLRVGGPYTVSISGGDFTPLEISDIYTSLDQTFPLNVTVTGQRTMDTVVVTASATQTGASYEGLSTSLGIEALQEVVSIDRDITDAAQLDPFAIVNVQSGGAKELSIAGANNRFNSLTIDGVALNDRFGLNANGFPTQRSPISFDAIESLSVQTAPFDVEFNGFTGGTINAVTKSGTNEFSGSAYYFFTDDSLIGDKSGDDEFNFTFEEKTYGATLGGPIIKDKLFCFVSYDLFEETAPLSRGPIGSGALREENVTQADIQRIQQVVSDTYGFDVGGFDKPPAEDEKILANIDSNINNDHPAKFTNIRTQGNTNREQNGNAFIQFSPLAFSSSWYDRSETVEAYIGHLFSDWTPNFSTEVKIAMTDQATGQDSLNGAEFFLGSVVTSTGTAISFGPDRFRHGNSLDQEFLNLKLKGTYLLDDHALTFGYEREEVDVNNLFAQNAEGTYAFASIDDLEAALATELDYDNAITNDENDLRAIWGYNYNSLYLQDTWDVSNDLTLQFGLRYDFYESEGEIRENANFFTRNGFSNTNDLDGLSVLLPRFSFDYDVNEDITVRGGIGRFSGGSPSVWVSNSYSNDGVINDGVSLEWDGSDRTTLINVPTTPDSATGQWIPQVALDDLANTAPDGSTASLADSFDIPTVWKANLGVAFNVDIGPSEDWVLSADVLYNDLENTPFWVLGGCEDPVATAPDGRGVYDCSRPEDIILGSVDEGSSFLFALAADKSWDTQYGEFDLFTSYTYADIQDIGYGTSSTATSNYSDSARFDLQRPSTGTSNFEVEHLFRLRLGWEKEFFPDARTRASLFWTGRSGQPYSYTFNENNNCVFDVGGGRCARESRVDDAGHLLYVPSGPSDPLFSSDSFYTAPDVTGLSAADAAAAEAAARASASAQQTAFFDYINSSELSQYAGGITERNGDTSDFYNIIDLRLQQEIPINFGNLEGHKINLFMDIENLGNLLNDDWGRVERTEYEYERSVVSARIVGDQFEYFDLRDDEDIKNLEVLNQSVWQIQFGIKYEF
ncbi:MAG: TonB-dependent receptor [Pseudomonadota bacterium]